MLPTALDHSPREVPVTDWETLRAGGHIVGDVEMGSLTTYKLGGRARWFCEPGSVEAARNVITAASERGVGILVLGRGSNLVVSDYGFDGLVVRLTGEFRDVHIDRDAGLVTAGAAAALPVLARRVAKDGFGSLEFYVGIPGSVGGAVVMNAGFYGTETSDVLASTTVLDMRTGSVSEPRAADLGFAYRTSKVAEDDLVLGAVFAVRRRSVTDTSALMREAIRWRRDNQPGGTLNAGSIFRNPPGDAAGRIIDSLGLKGMRRGGAHVSHRHANFFVADPGTRSQDVYDLVGAVRRLVHERSGILLEPEVRFVGRFEPIQGTERDG